MLPAMSSFCVKSLSESDLLPFPYKCCLDGDVSLFQDRYCADNEIDAFERLHPARADEAKRRGAPYLGALCFEAVRVDHVFFFMDWLPDLYCVCRIFAVARDRGWCM